SRNLLPYLSAEQNVRFAQTAALHAGRSRRELPAARDVLDLVGLSGRARVKRRPHDLTPGERQRLALAVALANGPGLLLADEPTSQLDTRARDEVLAALVAVGQAGTTVVVVTHDPLVGAQMGRTVTIRDGRVGAEGRMGGADYSVVGRDGSLHLPPEVLQVFAPGSLVAVVLEADGTARLLPADASAPSRPAPSAVPAPAQRPQAFEPYQPVSTFEPALREPPVFQAAPARPERSVFDATPRSAPPPPPPTPVAPARPAAREPDPAQRDGITGFTTAGSAEFDYWGEE